ncbi:SagB family peptide dehydrogenase [Saccharomonospora viridis]|uniref:Nitroreductase n=2 Tax=Saccharomonospora viridis TaxID=1852 RepID=C7MY51_SACVD|nr:SagB family peptide dehydrogenase [Saccharomonospora viridis]ACU95999.1 nitroreductase [Saccharomonospora viridis DSM 43017]KHF45503.1 nitroreductase [Saccharomonospora viridis]SFP75348.1 SagB-type dehydrogenase domain-containing protein [Saccharomonospora viridis]
MTPQEITERALAVHRLLNAQRPVPVRPLPLARRIPLPDVHPPKAGLVATLARRHSSYEYSDEDLTLSALSALLRFSMGVQRFVPAYGVEEYPLSMAPSAGGLDILRAYAVVRRVAGLDQGVYRYEPVSHELVQLTETDPGPELEQVYLQDEFAWHAAATVAITARLDVAFGTYPLRHYRTLHVDSGVAVQNLYLVNTALGLAGCAVAGFDDAALSTMLGLPEHEIPTMLFATGHPA